MKAAAFLRLNTRLAHQQTEAVALGKSILDHTLSKSQYLSLISKNFYLHKHLEPLLLNVLTQYHLSEFKAFLHPRLDALREDARLLAIDEHPYAVKPPAFANRSQALGGLYVLLGANLGGKVIHGALRENLHLQEIPSFHYYASSGARPAAEWPQFCRRLDHYLHTEDHLQEAVAGAEKVFAFFRSVHAARA